MKSVNKDNRSLLFFEFSGEKSRSWRVGKMALLPKWKGQIPKDLPFHISKLVTLHSLVDQLELHSGFLTAKLSNTGPLADKFYQHSVGMFIKLLMVRN